MTMSVPSIINSFRRYPNFCPMRRELLFGDRLIRAGRVAGRRPAEDRDAFGVPGGIVDA